jgi:DNA modification methylase
MSNKLSWRTEMRRISDLVPNITNPRVMSVDQMEQLKRSIKKYDLVELPVIDTDKRVIAGHQRLLALKLLGRENEQIPVRVPNRKLTQKEYDRYLLSSNRIHGDWDWEKLATNFDLGDILASGFDDTDLSRLFDDMTVEDDEFDVDDEIKKIKKPRVKTGEVYQLGRHRIIVGDSTDPKVLKRLMDGNLATVILQDPPFNIGLSYDKGVGGKANYGGSVDDAKTDDEYRTFLKKALENGLSALSKDAHIFTYCDQRYVGLLQSLYAELGIDYRRTCLWIKNNITPTPHVAFSKQYEACIYGVRNKPYLSKLSLNFSEIMNRDIGVGNRTSDDILDMLDIWMARRVSAAEYEHPTQKPPSLHEKALRRCSKPGDIILDCFSGSGSLMTACEQLGRTAYMVEREPIFVEVTLGRYEKLTGEKAKRIG